MDLSKINALQKKVIEEAETAVNEIYEKYSAEMNELIKQEVPINHKLINFNGMSWIENKKGEKVDFGKAWGLFSEDDDDKLSEIASFQYSDSIYGSFDLNQEIEGLKTV